MESFTAFIPINRYPLTCPWTPPVPSLYSVESSNGFELRQQSMDTVGKINYLPFTQWSLTQFRILSKSLHLFLQTYWQQVF